MRFSSQLTPTESLHSEEMIDSESRSSSRLRIYRLDSKTDIWYSNAYYLQALCNIDTYNTTSSKAK